MNNKYIQINKSLPTTHYKYDKETKLWHGFIKDSDNKLIQDFGYNESFDELEKLVKRLRGEN